MKFLTFFTFGGHQFWEDVFYYQRWRIQRNFWSKRCRILDPWDIRRGVGTYMECKKKFEDIKQIYELPKQKGHMVIMLHDLLSNKNVFKKMWKEFVKTGFEVASINYPSTRRDIKIHAKQIEFFLNNLEGINKVSFVTHGVGGIILRYVLRKNSKWRERLEIGRVVQICPPNNGSTFLEEIYRFKIFREYFGPMLYSLRPINAQKIPKFSKSLEYGIITSSTKRNWNPFIKGKNDGAFLEEETKLQNCKHYYNADNFLPLVIKSRPVIAACIRFIKNGDFHNIRRPLKRNKKLIL